MESSSGRDLPPTPHRRCPPAPSKTGRQTCWRKNSLDEMLGSLATGVDWQYWGTLAVSHGARQTSVNPTSYSADNTKTSTKLPTTKTNKNHASAENKRLPNAPRKQTPQATAKKETWK